MITIKLGQVKKYYEERLVLDVSTELVPGNLYAVLGPNGSGKSTLLRQFSLLEEADSGEVLFFEKERVLAKDRELRRKIVLVPDRKGLFNDTVLNNAVYGLKIRHVAQKERAVAVEKALRAVGLWRLRKSNALTLSTGESQRLCLAMALAVEPQVILLDEPTSSLDPNNVLLVEEIIRNMKQHAALIVLVTHNIFQAKRLADQVIFLYQGNILENSTANTFFAQPSSEIAKQFLAGEIVC